MAERIHLIAVSEDDRAVDPNDTARIRRIVAQIPTLRQAFACEECEGIFAIAINDRCPDCNSIAIFNLAALLDPRPRPSKGGDASETD